MKKIITTSATALSLIACIQAANAADIKINGFASITAGKTLSQGDDFAAPSGKATYFVDGSNGGAYDDDISFKPDSLYGLQFSSDLGDGLRITGQMVGHGSNDFDAEFNWVYVSYDITPNTTVSAGRMGFPLYYYSDFLNVRYAYHWLRGPADTYTLPVNEYEGVSLLQRYTLGDNWDGAVQLFTGSYESELNGFGGDPFEGRDVVGLIGTIGNDWLQLRAVGLQQDTFHEGDEEIAADSSFIGFAVKADFDSWFLMSEYTRYDFESPVRIQPGITDLHQGTSAYISLAYRLGAFTPHITYSERDIELQVIPLSNQLLEASNESWTLGLRWDFHPNAALKFEYNTSSDKSDALYTAAAGDRLEVDNFAIGMDLVF